jgi:hypothetical protein
VLRDTTTDDEIIHIEFKERDFKPNAAQWKTILDLASKWTEEDTEGYKIPTAPSTPLPEPQPAGGRPPTPPPSEQASADDGSKIQLMILRPSIEHYMLGICIGRGGTQELGATFWGQTELSCYDDAFYGKWGMSYKYHERAMVLNEKNLVRLWDVAFNGYVGGGDDTLVDFRDPNNRENGSAAWKKAVHDISVPYTGPSLAVLAFKTKDAKPRMHNPININCPPDDDRDGGGTEHFVEPENIYTTHDSRMDLFLKDEYREQFNAKYADHWPEFNALHRERKTAGHAANEGDTHSASLSFEGTMQYKMNGYDRPAVHQKGTGHLGESFVGVASVRAGKGLQAYMNTQPTMGRMI